MKKSIFASTLISFVISVGATVHAEGRQYIKCADGFQFYVDGRMAVVALDTLAPIRDEIPLSSVETGKNVYSILVKKMIGRSDSKIAKPVVVKIDQKILNAGQSGEVSLSLPGFFVAEVPEARTELHRNCKLKR